MSQLNIEELQMNQWMFMFDGFGIRLEDAETQSQERDPFSSTSINEL